MSPHERLARGGAADAILHVALRRAGVFLDGDGDGVGDELRGLIPETDTCMKSRVATACFRFIQNLASRPCADAVRKRLAAEGAMDRIAATRSVFLESGDAVSSRAVDRAARAALRALVDGNEKNMRHAFALGLKDIVW
jgi:hypothetical protein